MDSQKITEDEILFMESWHDPVCMVECLFSDFDNLAEFDEERMGSLRLYQLPMISYEPIINAERPELTLKQNFKLRKNVGDIYNIGSRKIGKTQCSELIDIPISMLHDDGWPVGVSSADSIHLREVLDTVKRAMETHPILKMWHPQIRTSPSYSIRAKNGWRLAGINMNLNAKDPGDQFFGKHMRKLWIEECSFENERVYEKRKESYSELGAVLRISGMTNFTRYSPTGKTFYDSRNKSKLLNLPQYCIAQGSKILMDDFSTTNIEDIKIGDSILTIPEKRPYELISSKVTNKICNGEKEIYEINNQQNSLFLTKDHKFLMKNKSEDKLWLNLDQLKEYHLVYNINYIENMKDYYEGLFLGILETEGSFKIGKKGGVSYSIGQKSEKECLEFVLNKLGLYYTKYADNRDSDFCYYYLPVKNREYIISLYQKLNDSRDCQYGFLAGCIVGDGCISTRKSTIGMKSSIQIGIVQKNKCQLIENVFNSVNLKYGNHIDKQDAHRYSISKMGFPFHAPYSHKFVKYKNLILGSTLKSISKSKIKVTGHRFGKVWDLTTKAGSFIANGFVVHNCNPMWDEEEKEDRKLEYGGESSIAFRVFVKGEVIEDSVSEFDMVRFQEQCVLTKKEIKRFEIQKKQFKYFDSLVVCERPNNADRILVCADIGEGAGTDIIILSEVSGCYNYLYNIILYGMTRKEQLKIFKWVIQKMQANIVGLDCGDAMGRNLADDLEETYSKENVVRYDGGAKLNVGFETENNGDTKLVDGKPIYRREYMKEWSVDRLKVLFYEGKCKIPRDYKLESQLSNVISTMSGTRKIYSCVHSSGDHLFEAWRVFAIAEWLKHSFNDTPQMLANSWGSGASSWSNSKQEIN